MFCGRLVRKPEIARSCEAKDYELLIQKEDFDAWSDWHPPMILEQYGSFKRTSFSNGYELPDPTEGRAKLVKSNCPTIKKWKIPIFGESKRVETLTDGEGNEIPLKIETGSYWLPGIANKYKLESSILKQQLKMASSKAAKRQAATNWKNGLMNELKLTKKDIKDARKEILKVKKAGTKIPVLKSVQAKAGLFSAKSNFVPKLEMQGDARDIWSQNRYQIGDILAEQKEWIQGLEKRKTKILKELKKLKL